MDDLDWALEDKPSSSKKKSNRALFNSDGLDFVAAEDFAAMLESNAQYWIEYRRNNGGFGQ